MNLTNGDTNTPNGWYTRRLGSAWCSQRLRSECTLQQNILFDNMKDYKKKVSYSILDPIKYEKEHTHVCI